MIGAAEHCRAVKIIAFGRRHMATVRQQLDYQHESRIGFASKLQADANHAKLFGVPRA